MMSLCLTLSPITCKLQLLLKHFLSSKPRKNTPIQLVNDDNAATPDTLVASSEVIKDDKELHKKFAREIDFQKVVSGFYSFCLIC
jgi:hypothetical protein